MAETAASQPDPWSEESLEKETLLPSGASQTFPISESEEFHDPYSDLSLFLSKKIKQEIAKHKTSRKWSSKIQTQLMQKIMPEFKVQFPRYRLGNFALKKTFEKVAYYYDRIYSRKEAIKSDGKLNVDFVIRENLKESLQQKQHSEPAHRIAMKMSECIAALEGERTNLSALTRKIWAVQKHLLVNSQPNKLKSPLEQYDEADKLIVKLILERASQKALPSDLLKEEVKEDLEALSKLPTLTKSPKLYVLASSILAQKRFADLDLFKKCSEEEAEKTMRFIQREIDAGKKPIQVVKRIKSLCLLSKKLPEKISPKKLQEAIKDSYFRSANPFAFRCSFFDQAIYDFINAEMLLRRDETATMEKVLARILEGIQAIHELPKLQELSSEDLEILIWKLLSDREELIKKTPRKSVELVENELVNTLIEEPHLSFHETVHTALQFFKKSKELALEALDEERIDYWTVQNELLYHSIKLDESHPLMNLIEKNWKAHKKNDLSSFVHEVQKKYLHKTPELITFSRFVTARIWMLVRYFWFKKLASLEESAYNRFLEWHASQIPAEDEELVDHLEKITAKLLPLIPFERAHCAALFA